MVLKDWKKTKTANNPVQTTWVRQINNEYRWITIHHTKDEILNKKVQFVYLSRKKHIESKYFKTKEKALAYAKAYMRSH